MRRNDVTSIMPATRRSLDHRRVASAFSKLPAGFEPNRGQADPSVRFLSRGPGYELLLTSREAVLSLSLPARRRASPNSGRLYRALRMKILDCHLPESIEGQNLLPQRSNYLLGNRPARRQTGIPNYSRVRYKSIYPGIDMVFHGDPSQLEFDLEAAPGADFHHVRLRLDGTDGIRLDTSGDLIAHLDSTELRLHRPVAYQRTSGGDRPVMGRFTLSSSQEIGFCIDNYDASQPLVIDPVLSYSTFFGGTGADQALAVAVDSQGDFYVTGQTASSDFPVSAPLLGTYSGFTDAFVAKFKGDGSGLVYSTYLGGSFLDTAQAIAVDSLGNAYVTGFTTSTDFPTKNPLQAALNGTFGQDLFITKLSPDGSSLVYSTYLGGSGLDTIAAIALDAQDEVVLAGTTKSTDFPLANALETNLHGTSGNSDAFVAKIAANGSALVFSTYLGGAGVDGATGVAVDSQGNIVVSGGTNSTDFPTMNALQANFGGGTTTNNISADAFLTKLKGDGSAILFSTYWGGSNSDQAADLSLDGNDNIFVVGETNSADFPTSNQTKIPGSAITGFVTKFKPDGSSVLFSTIFGGSGTDFIYGSAVDPNGNIYVSGNTTSTDLPLANPLQSTYGGGTSDGFVSELSENGSTLLFSTYLGGSNTDGFDRMAGDANGIYVVGSSSSSDFPTAGDPLHISQYVGGGDGVVVKITTPSGVSFSINSLTFADQAVGTTSTAQSVTLSNGSGATLNITNVSISPDYGQTNDCGSALAAGANCTFNITFTPTATGSRPGTLTITDNASGSPQTVTLTGNGVAPVAVVAPSSLTFSNQPVGTTSASQTVTLTNTGTAPLTLDSVSATGDFSFTNNCGATVAVNSSCTIDVTFSPKSSGPATGKLTISDNTSDSPQSVNLTGTGTGPTASLSPTSLTFGSQLDTTTSTAQTVTLTNSGNAALAITSVAITGTNNGDFAQTNTCGTSVTPGASCTISVSFTPSATGNRAAAVTITDSASGSPHSVGLTGTGSDFNLAPASGSTTSAAVMRGQTANFSLSLAPTGGVSGTVAFTCAGAPSEATCTVSPASVATNGTSATPFTVSVTTTAASLVSSRLRVVPPVGPRWPVPPAQLVLGLLLLMMTLAVGLRGGGLVGAWPRRSGPLRVIQVAGAVALAALLTLAVSCGGGGNATTPSNPGTPTGSYSLTITATLTSGAASLKHNLSLTLNVQ